MIKKITVDDYHNNNSLYFSGRQELTHYWIFDKTRVNYGYQNDCNIKWCKENNIPVFNDKRGGGCLVSTEGNLVVVNVRQFDGHTWFVMNILKDFAKWLNDRGVNAEINRNDILVDGFKVVSGVSSNIRPEYKMQYTGVQFSINQDLNVIEHVCKKKMVKKPKGLSEFGITTQDVENWLIEYFK